jgi:hypothetical protein
MTSRHRSFTASLFSLVALLLASAGWPHFASATQTAVAAADRRTPSGVPLPPGIHRKKNGRYVRDLCARQSGPRLHCLARELLPEPWQPGDLRPELGPAISEAGSSESPVSASAIAAAYSLPPWAKANGRVVAVLDTADNHALADLMTYRNMHGLPAMDRCSGLPTGTGTPCFAQVAQDGSASTNTDPSPAGDGETSLDTDMVSLGCPDCSILLVELDANLCETDLLEGVATAARFGASAITISLAGPEATDPSAISVDSGGADDGTTGCPAEARWTYDAPGPFSTPGHLVLASSGDYAYDDALYDFPQIAGGAAPSYPASSPYVMAVGGTALYWNGSSTGEGVWEGTTSGCSTEFAMPPWQATVLAGTACTARATADVSAMAAFFANGVEIGIEAIVDGKVLVTDGTSASSPLVAGIFTRLGLTTEMSNDLSWPYSNSSAFNDIGSPSYPIPAEASNTNAQDESSCGILCIARTGWDGPSGVGSPNGTKLAALPVSTAGPQRYPDAGICGPLGACAGSEGEDEDGPAARAGRTDGDATGAQDGGDGTPPRGCACSAGSRGRSSGKAWAIAAFCVAVFRRKDARQHE